MTDELKQAANKITGAENAAKAKAQGVRAEVRGDIQKTPFEAIGAAFVAGVLFGLALVALVSFIF